MTKVGWSPHLSIDPGILESPLSSRARAATLQVTCDPLARFALTFIDHPTERRLRFVSEVHPDAGRDLPYAYVGIGNLLLRSHTLYLINSFFTVCSTIRDMGLRLAGATERVQAPL